MYQDLILKITAALSSHNIPYVLIGGQAILLHGEPRMTNDIDITLGLDTDEFERLHPILTELGLVPLVENINSFIETTRVLPVKEMTSGIRVDLIFTFIGYERTAIERAVPFRMKNGSVMVASKEDMIIMKIIAGRGRDIEDAAGVILKNKKMDEEYIVNWLKEFSFALENDFIKIYFDLKKRLSV